ADSRRNPGEFPAHSQDFRNARRYLVTHPAGRNAPRTTGGYDMTRGHVAPILAAFLVAAVILAGGWAARPSAHENHSSPAHEHQPGALVQAVREATEPFRDPMLADAAGYKPQFGCVSAPERGAMGLHFVKSSLVAD